MTQGCHQGARLFRALSFPQHVSIFVTTHVVSQSQHGCHSATHPILIQLYSSLAHVPLSSSRKTSPRSLTRGGSCAHSPDQVLHPPSLRSRHLLSGAQGSVSRGTGWDDFEPGNQQYLPMVPVRPGKEREPGQEASCGKS